MRTLTIVSVSLGAFLSACTASAPQDTIVDLCTQTVRDYAVLRDEGPAEAYANLFTPDGTFVLGGAQTTGHAALIARHTSANDNALWRHTMTDIRITPVLDGASGVSRFIIDTGPHPAPSASTRRIIGDYEDTFAIENGVCKIKLRTVRILFDNQA